MKHTLPLLLILCVSASLREACCADAFPHASVFVDLEKKTAKIDWK